MVRGNRVPFNAPTCPELDAWLYAFRGAIMQRTVAAVTQATYTKKSWNNTPPLLNWALRVLRDRGLRAWPNDKGSSYTLARNDDTPSLFGKVLSMPCYIFAGSISDAMRNGLSKQYSELCKSIEESTDTERMASQLRKSWFVQGSTFISKLQLNIKLSKNPIGIRPIHSMPAYSFAGVALWVRNIINEFLSQRASHLLRDCSELVSELKGVHPSDLKENAYFLHADVKDFFLSGTIQELVSLVMQIFPPGWELHAVFKRAIDFLLSSQFLRLENDHDASSTWQVIIGSGMGLPHSGEISDAALYSCMEARILNQEALSRYSIVKYLRYRDDILILANERGESGGSGFLKLAMQHSKPYILKCVSVGKQVSFLECTCIINKHGVRVSHHLKDSALRTPLSPNSAHAPSTHRAWPKAIAPRIFGLCTDEGAYQSSLTSILSRIRSGWSHHYLYDSVSAYRGFRRNRSMTGHRPNDIHKHTMWCGFGFHPILRSLQRVVHDFNNGLWKHILHKAFDQQVSVHICWSTHAQSSLAARLARISST